MMLMKTLFAALPCLFQACSATAQQGGPQSPPPAQPQERAPRQEQPQLPQQQQQSQRQQPDGVIALLDTIERSSSDLKSFTAKITYEKQDPILGDAEIRSGELIYRLDDDGAKAFAVLFDTQIVRQRLTQRLQHYIFDGRWLAEIDHQNKQFIKREIVRPGQQLDPLKLGEGPFPIPVGQAKADVLARFDVSAAQLPNDPLLADLKDVNGLLLVPKPGTQEAKDFQRVEVFYDKATNLPAGIKAIDSRGDVKLVRLNDLRRNPQLDEATLKKLDIREPDPRQWRIDVRPWTEPAR